MVVIHVATWQVKLNCCHIVLCFFFYYSTILFSSKLMSSLSLNYLVEYRIQRPSCLHQKFNYYMDVSVSGIKIQF